MKLPVTVSGEALVDADCKTVAIFTADAGNRAHLAEIAAALNEAAALRGEFSNIKREIRLALAEGFDYGDRDEAESVAFMRDQYQIERAALRAQVASLVAALQQYADPQNWDY